MDMPLWIYICSPLKLIIYAVAMFALEYVVTRGMMCLIDGVDNKAGTTAKCMSWLFVATVIVQALGFGIMGVASTTSDSELAYMLKAADYSEFSCFRIPLCIYFAGVALMYIISRFLIFKNINTDDLTRKVASVIIALVSAPWIIMLPIAV